MGWRLVWGLGQRGRPQRPSRARSSHISMKSVPEKWMQVDHSCSGVGALQLQRSSDVFRTAASRALGVEMGSQEPGGCC